MPSVLKPGLRVSNTDLCQSISHQNSKYAVVDETWKCKTEKTFEKVASRNKSDWTCPGYS